MQKINIVYLLSIIGFTAVLSCTGESNQIEKVKTHCGSCHLVPDPSHLYSDTWEKGVFPEMSNYYVWENTSTLYPYANKTFYNKKGQLPMDDETWTAILNYFKDNASKDPIRSSMLPDQEIFDEEIINYLSSTTPQITAIDIDEAGVVRASTIRSGFSHSGLYKFTLDNLSDSIITLQEDIVSQILPIEGDSLLLLDMGRIDPQDQPIGSVSAYNYQESEMRQTELIGQLKRPVYLSKYANDLIISEFGHVTGSVTRYSLDNIDNDKQTLLALPGCYKSYITNDKMIVVCSQAHEGIYEIDLRDPDKKRAILTFPPEFGLSDMEVADMNGDGHMDIIMTNGDNADYSIQAKEYHGVRIFLNDGTGNYEESFFHPMYGASQVKVVDFNLDGNLDIIAASYFAVDPDESVQILINNGNKKKDLGFIPSKVKFASKGLWIVMDTGDLDGDGDDDVVIGSNLIGPTEIKDEVFLNSLVENSIEFLVLLNRSKN